MYYPSEDSSRDTFNDVSVDEALEVLEEESQDEVIRAWFESGSLMVRYGDVEDERNSTDSNFYSGINDISDLDPENIERFSYSGRSDRWEVILE